MGRPDRADNTHRKTSSAVEVKGLGNSVENDGPFCGLSIRAPTLAETVVTG
ncbi:hypothetical protein M2390_000338 [Mycetocola sp. BIGb0189]|uniref:hypothetical protein n=1 Tax=Mycetocola sp. BIGb0189 TaxID=2940604 RepID=UPI002167291A|nr:hypothetical protein [Mycetocola sp. BIGb0189]MCS4275180.1 hypothetical protein [Mycetocola sp. BIGb0189]